MIKDSHATAKKSSHPRKVEHAPVQAHKHHETGKNVAEKNAEATEKHAAKHAEATEKHAAKHAAKHAEKHAVKHVVKHAERTAEKHGDKHLGEKNAPAKAQKNSHPVKVHHKAMHALKKKVALTHHRHKAQPVGQPWWKHSWVWAAALLPLIAVVFFVHAHQQKLASQKAHKTGPPAIPVSTTLARKGDIGIYLEALGTVTPISTVLITSRVQGQIMEIKYIEGQVVHKGDPLVEIDPRPYEAALKQAEGQLSRDNATLHKDRINFTRYQKAYAAKAIAKQQLDDQMQIVQQDEGNVKSDEGALESAQVNLAYCHITSPIDGRVGLRLVDVGNMVQANSPTNLAIVTQMQPIDVVFSVPEDNLAQIQEQVKADQGMEVDAFDRSQEKKISQGRFLTLDNQIDTSTGSVKIKGVFENQDSALFPNQFVNVRLLVTTQKGATLVLSEAIQRNTKGPYVFIVKPDQTAEIREIKTGAVDGDVTAVSGVQEGETVATNGFDKLQDGIKVAPKAEEPKKAPEKGTVAEHQTQAELHL